METVSRYLLTFLLNSLWQIPLIVAVAALACRVMRNGPARHVHAVWVAALFAALLLPTASIRAPKSSSAPEFHVALDPTPTVTARNQVRTAPAPAPPPRTVSIAQSMASLLIAAYLLFVLFRLARLARASVRTFQICRAAEAIDAPAPLHRVALRCRQALGVDRVELRFSAEIAGPVTAGRAVILPQSLLTEPSEAVLTTAIGHEMAHIARRDFGCKLLYELLHLPVSFHPAAWLIHRGIERSREMACDELVTARLLDAGVYARSIMSIAGAMVALPSPGYTLGVFDGDVLEERIRRLVARPAANLKRARLLLITGLTALAVCAVIASSVALTARAQSSADAFMKQAEAAYNRGNQAEAIAQFENAVKADPANLKAKLFLAGILMQHYTAGTDPSNPVVDRARQQYTDVLARDKANPDAIEGMMNLLVKTKQFAEAHDWAVAAIHADATNKGSYYVAGFTDWAMSYPDYAAARLAAGMQPPDPGIIPDVALRLKVRTDDMARIEDGMRMLQTALQLDPGYSDAMAYMNLLNRIQAGIVDSPPESADLIAKADDWMKKALAARRAQSRNPQPADRTLNVDGPASAVWDAPPPPPPPPPPPGSLPVPPNAVRVEGSVQASKLVSQTAPVYPPLALQARISGTVQLNVVIAKDGTVRDAVLLRGHPLLAPAALDAVRKWVYRQTLLNGEPVEVFTSVNVNFNADGQ